MIRMSNQAMDKVVSNDDLVLEILSRLPVRPLLHFKTVSKHWYSLISNPNFIMLLHPKPPDPPSGLFVPVQTHRPLACEFISFDIHNPIKPRHVTPNCPDPKVHKFDIEHSCNGLMLFSSQTCDFTRRKRVISDTRSLFEKINKSYIYNPTTNHFATLPVLDVYDNSDHRYGMNLAFDPAISPHYKVLYVSGIETDDDDDDMSYQIEIYSSQTRTFKLSYTRFTLDQFFDIDFKGGVFRNNAFHWVNCTGAVVYFNMDREVIRRIRPPVTPVGSSNLNCSYTLFASRDCLLLVEVHRRCDWKVKIHELKRDYSGWFVKYHVDLEQLGLSYPEIAKNDYSVDTYEFSVLSLVLGEKGDDDSFLVLEIPGKVVRFNLVSKTSHKLHDFTSSRPRSDSVDINDILCQWPYVFQFMESLYSF